MDNIKKELSEYFEYIKTIYLNEYKKYMNEDTIVKIKAIDDVFVINNDLTFKINTKDKININLNIKKYIEENNLKDEKSLLDLDQNSREYIKYILKNENNVAEILKNKILKETLLLFTKNSLDVVTLGTVSILEEQLVNKYKLPFENYLSSKEKEVALYIRQIVGNEILLKGIINNDQNLIASNYNLYIEEDSEKYSNLTNSLNKIYLKYNSKIGKVYLADSLYEYNNIDYKINQKTNEVKDEKNVINISRIKHLASIKLSLIDISKHKFLFNALERVEIENSLIEINKIIEKIMIDGKDKITEHISEQYNKILEVEKDNDKFIDKIWSNTLTSLNNYKQNGDFNFIVGSQLNNDIIEASFISSEHLRQIKNTNNNYGFIYEPKVNGIVYASSKNVTFKRYNSDAYIPNHNTMYVSNIPIELDNYEESKLITPEMILKNNLKEKAIQNKIILDSNKIRIVGVYCFVDDDLENNSNYNRAIELSENYNLPIIKIYKEAYYIEKNEPKKIEIKIEDIKNESVFNKIKNTRGSLI